MGKGKGSVDHYVFPVKPGRILFELDGVSYQKVKEAFRLANSKLPIKTSIIQR
jgi:large subunit ribosomal protein L16